MQTERITWDNSQLIEKNILEIGDGYRAKNSEMGASGLPFARAGNIDNGFHFDNADILGESSIKKAGNKISQPYDIVFTSKGTVGRFAFVRPETPKFVYSPQLCYWRVKNPSIIDPLYLFYWMHSSGFKQQVHQVKSLTTMADYVSLSDQRKMHIIIPFPPIQHTIASILSAYDDLVENNTRRIAILEEMAQMLYQEWFVKFRFPGYEQVKMVESELGMIPEGWRIAQLGDIALELRRSVNPESVDPETPYFGLEHIPRKSIALTDWGKAQTVQSTKLTFKKGEILFGKIRPYLHKVGVAPLDGVCSSDTIVMAPNQEHYMALLLCCVSSDHFIAFASKTSQGTQMPRANWNVLATFPIAIPPLHLLSLFNDFVGSAVNTIVNFVFRNRILRHTRDLLLPKLISGEIDVSSWVERDMEEVAQEMAASVAGVTGAYEQSRQARRVAETGPVAPIEKDEVEWRSLWE
jgi:type I restriction enzyme, S subunit